MNSEDTNQQIETLKMAIARSEAAINALQNSIRMADKKLKQIRIGRNESEVATCHLPFETKSPEMPLAGLKMYQP